MPAGRKPKPVELKILHGNPGKRELPKTRPSPSQPHRAPSPPDWLTDVGKQEWRRVARILHRLRVLTDADLTALAAYCDAYSRWRDARKQIEDQGITTETGAGNLKAHPATTVVHQAMLEMRQFMSEFGLTPASRVRVHAGQAREPSEFEKFLARRSQNSEASNG